jgi:hypothetical protein
MAKVKHARVRAGAPPISRTLTFSFKHLDLNHSKFKMEHCTVQFYHSLLAALKDFSERMTDDFRDINYTKHRHIIVFEETTEPSGFGISGSDENDFWEQPWQFALEPECNVPPNSLWRVHGVIINDAFYLIWLDPQHRLYATV